MNTLKCVACEPNCLKCGTSDQKNCFECENIESGADRDYLLEDGACVEECTKDGFFANRAST